MSENIFDYVQTEEEAYQTLPIPIIDNYDWSMTEHIKLSVLYKNSIYSTGKSDDKPFKNITRPILTLQYHAEGFDVKNIDLFVNDSNDYYKSFLVKKYHEKWARKNDIDTFIDEMVESYVDFGGALVKDVNQKKPEVVPLQRIAFCDQSDILGGTICEKHSYSPDQFKEAGTAGGWGKTSNGATATLEEVIRLAKAEKQSNQTPNRKTKKVGKSIDVYEVHGMFPKYYLDDDYAEEEDSDVEYTRQLHIIVFYKDTNQEAQGFCLFKGKEKEHPYKLLLRDKMYGRGLGLGGAEELFEPQVWVNYDIIRIKEMLDMASKMMFQTADTSFSTRNNVRNADNGEIFVHEEGKPLESINNQPVNIAVFEKSVSDWEAHAKQMGSANDALMGVSPASGTPFALQDLVVQTGNDVHEYRRGKIATFTDEIYRDWIIPQICKEIVQGDKWMTELTLEELQSVADAITENAFYDYTKAKMLNGEVVTDEFLAPLKEKFKTDFMKSGSKRFLEIFKAEMKDAPIDVEVNIAGKQKNLAERVNKLTNIFRQILASPQILENPQMAKLFNQIIESSGLSPLDFSGFKAPAPPQSPPRPGQPVPSPLQQNQLQNNQPAQ